MSRQSAILNAIVAFLPITLGLAFSFASGYDRLTGLVIAICLAVTSLVCLLSLKHAALRNGRLFSFGPAQASGGRRWLWWLALILLLLSSVFAVMVFAPR